ncbi:Glutamate racemase [Ralstonia edaphis]|uniref:glutamate cyclase domain-containing protein n=1 Tax=Ralstonia edaphi TaxID=3058599 RepID=UPI0028F525B6|nr:glutamate cyclase domain-containing protein [Ralstonia sp. LMG 6871]CAJ0706223.1 Glutamate racemase [Ralstonia sp. LMG 6871]
MPAIDEINGRIVYYRPPPPPPAPTPEQKQAAADAKTQTDAAIQTANTAVNNYINNGDDSTAAQAKLDKPLSDVINSVQNELRRQADEAPAGSEKKAIEDAAAAIKKRDPDAKWLDKIVDDAKDAVEKQDPSQRTASEARDGVLNAQDKLQDAQDIKVTNRTIAEDKQDAINTAQANLNKAIQDFKAALGGELSTYENFGSGDNLKAANDAVDAVAKAHPDWDDGSLAFARNIATADAIQYQINHINPNDPTLSAQDKALATNDPVQLACVQLARPYASDPNAEKIYEQIGAASYDVRVTYTKDQVAAKMKAGDAEGALKILSTNMNDVSVTSADPDARAHLYEVAGAPFFNAHSDYFNKQITDLTQVYKYNPDDPDANRKMADSTVKYDAVGTWMKDLAKVAPPEVAGNLLTTVEDRFNDNGHWFQSNAGPDTSGLVPHGSDFYGGLSLTAAVADAPRFASDQPSTDHAQQVANWLTSNSNAKSFLYSMQTSGSGGSMPSWVPVQNAVGDGNGATVTNALIQHHGKDLPNADMLQRAFDRGNEKVQAKQAEADYKTFQSDQNGGLKTIFGQMSKATFGKDTPLYNDTAQTFSGADADTQLKNYIGGALMIQADNAGAQSSGNTGTAWFTSGNSTKVINEVDKAIHEAGGDNPTVKAIPIAYVDKSAGVMPTALFEVADKNGGKPHYIDDRGWDYSSLDDYRHNNALSDGGTIYVPKNLAGTVALGSNGVPDVDHFSAHITTTGQKIRHVVDIVAGVATAVGGVILSVGTFGGASIVGGAMVAVGTGWIVGESVDHLHTLADHGRSWSPLNPEATNDWLAIVTSAAGEYSLAGKGLVAVSDVANASRLFKITRSASDLVAGGGGMIMTGAQVKDLLMYGDRMSGEQKAESIMFLGLGLGQVGATRMLERVGLSQGTERVGLLNALKNNADRYKPTEMAPDPTTVAANDPASAGRPTTDPTTEPVILQAGNKTPERGGTTPGNDGNDGNDGKPGTDPIDPATGKPKAAGDPATEPGKTGTPGDEGNPTNTGPARPSRPLPGALDDLANPEVTLTGFTDTQKALDAATQNALSQHADLLLDAENYRTDGTTIGRHPRGIGVRRLAAKLAEMSDEQRRLILSKAEFAHDTANIKDPVRMSWRQRMQLYRGKSSVFGRTADRIMSPVDRIQALFVDRGIRKFFVKGGTEDAAAALKDSQRILLVTGFTVGRDPVSGRALPETDGPVGTAEMAAKLALAGRDMTIATDSANMPVVQSVLASFDGGHLVKLEPFDAKRGQPARDAANELLDRVQPDAVVAIELPARNADGDYLNMRGISVAEVNAPKDQIVLEANKRKGIITVGVGDGGNEAGMGSLRSNIPPVTLADNTTIDFASTVPVDHPVTAWNSNFGAQAILANMLHRMGRMDLMTTPEELHAAIKASVDAGAVDGVSRKSEASVDGFSSQVHQGMLVLLREAMNHMPRDKTFDEATPTEPFTFAAFDSSNGGLIAAKNMLATIKAQTGEDLPVAIVVDHANAPYGPKSPDALIRLVGNGLQTAQRLKAAMVAMACNTACTAFPKALENVDVPVIDLVDVTSRAIVEHGGERPAVIATAGTVKSHAYQDKVAALSGDSIHPQAVAAHKFADFVNQLKHKSDDPAVKKELQEASDLYVSELDERTTSLWLCCTHYPAMKAFLVTSLQKRGMDIPVVDPMQYQAKAVLDAIGQQEWKVPSAAYSSDPYVVTSGKTGPVSESAQNLMERPDVPVQRVRRFGPGRTLDSVIPSNPRLEPSPITNAVQALFTGDSARIENPLGIDRAAAALQNSNRILVLAGARNAHGAVDTDGMAGAAVFGHDMQAAGKNVVYVVPHEAVPALDAALQARGAAVNDYSIVPFNAEPGEPARATAQDLINEASPDTIVSINVHGRNADGRYIDQNGTDVTEQTVPLDEVAIAGWKTDGVTTIGVGSRGHEAGMGNTRRTAAQVTLPDGTVVDPRSVVPADHYVSASNSNWGAHGLAASVLEAAGRTDLLTTHQQHMDALNATASAGAVDGATGQATGTVGGHDSNTYQTVVQMINLAAGKKPNAPPPTAANATGPKGPTGPDGAQPKEPAATTEPITAKTSEAGDDGNGAPPTEPDSAASAGEPKRKPWIRWIFAGSLTGAFSTAASSATLTGSAATHAVFDPSVTSPLSFMYRGGIAALRANKTRAVSDQVGKLGTEDSDAALAWLKTNMSDHGRRWGVTKSDRQTIADAVTRFQDNPDALMAALSKVDDPKAKDDPDVQALLALKGAPGKLLSPKSPVGRANDTLQLLTLALNNGNTAYWFATHGAHLNTPSFWSNALFLSANLALSSRNFAGRLGATFNDKATNTSPWLNRAQAFTMSLYTVGSVPLAMNDALMHTNSPAMGATKAALDLAFGAGALRIAGDLMPKVGQRLPSHAMLPGGVILGVAAVTRFGIELFVPNQAAKPAVANVQANGNGQDQNNQPVAAFPLPDMQGVSGDLLRANAPHALPSIGTGTSPQYAIVGPGGTLWQLSAADAAKLLGTAGPASDARTAAALDKLPPMNSQFDWSALDGDPYTPATTGQDPDLVVPGDLVRIG